LREAVTRAFRGNVLTALRGVTGIRISALGEGVGPMGGAALVFEELFTSGALLFGERSPEPHAALLNRR
jgi:hypothetical protein